jgi:glycogen debranching enzyme
MDGVPGDPGGGSVVVIGAPNARPVNPPPLLLTSLASAAIGDGRGDLECTWESRGAPTEWGGVYAQLVRLTGPWRIGLALEAASTDLPSCRTDAAEFPGGWSSRHHWNGLDVVQTIVATARPAGVVRQLVVRSESDRSLPLEFTSRFSPYLLPVLVEGIRPVAYDVRMLPDSLSVRHFGFALRVSSSVAPDHLLLNQGSWLGGKYRGPVDELATLHPLPLAPGEAATIRWQLVGGLGRDLEESVAAVGVAPAAPEQLAGLRAAEDDRWVSATPELRFPDAPELEAGYRSARAALRRLYTAPDTSMVGLVAGYPWYSAIWCRDLAVMLPALLWLGDFDWVARSLASVFRFQSRKKVAILGGEPGELPMQIAPGPIFLYGTSDSTLRFPPVVEQMHRHTGDLGAVADWAGAVHRIVQWGQARTDPVTGLLRHGGEAEEIDRATQGVARVRCGIESVDTTIWDSADRRDHALDVEVLWWQTLVAASRLFGHVGDRDHQSKCEGGAARLLRTIRERYPWPAESYLYDSLRDGAPVARVRPNALRALSAGLFDPAFARAVVRRAAASDLTTPWGVRSLSSADPGFDPRLYHDGLVWTIATAWAADAAFAAGERALGVEYLRTIAARYVAEAGLASECYRGDRPEPYNSCFLLGFSVAPFLSALFERLWGLRVDGVAGRLEVHPGFPDHWNSAELRGLHIMDGRVDLVWTPGRLTVRWTGSRPLTVDAGAAPRIVTPGEEASLELPTPSKM